MKNWKKERRLEILNYDKKLHRKLLDEQTDKFSRELLTHSAILIRHLHWELRDEYIELLRNYVKNNLHILDFRIEFRARYESIEKVADFLELNRVLLSPNENSFEFTSLVSNVVSCCDIYSNDPEPFRYDYEIDDDEFRTLVEEIYFKIQKFEDSQRSDFNDIKVLQSIMGFFAVTTIVVCYSINPTLFNFICQYY